MAYDFSAEAKLTNEQLSDELAKLSPLTKDEVNKLLPKKIDKKHFMELIEIVNSSASKNNKLATLTTNFEKLGGVALTVLSKYLKPI